MRRRPRIRKALGVIAGGAVAVAASTASEFLFMDIEAANLVVKVIFLVLLNLNVLALMGLAYFVGKNAITLVRERRRGILGHKFKTKILAFFLILISIPSVLLFVVASGLSTNYIDRFFSPQFRRPMEGSVEMAKSIYDMERERALQFAEMARSGHKLPPQYSVTYLKSMPEDASEAVQEAFAGEHGAEIISTPGGDIVRAALPLGPADSRQGVIYVESVLPPSVTGNIAMIQHAYEDYVSLEKWISPLKMNYFLLLGLFTLMVIFTAIWVALKIAGWITEPVRSLAEATERVAAGDLTVRVSATTQDEMGLLIASFNRMVKEMREGKESLEQAYLNMENIVKNIQSGVISLDGRADVAAINAAACRVLGVKAEDVVGRHYTSILSLMESDELAKLIRGINLRTFIEMDREFWVSVGGRKLLLRISITGIRGSSGEHLGLLVVLDDLTDIVKAQRAVAWQEVARRMAHEIKNPLTPIMLSAERIRKKWQAKDADFGSVFETATETIIRETDSLRKMVDEFSRLGKMPELVKTPVEPSALIREVLELYRGYKDLSITFEDSSGPLVANLDGDQFKRVLINLIDNALEAVDRRGAIVVRMGPASGADKFRIEVADDGPGIRSEDKERLFQPYFSTRKNGTGLGLAIADRIITEHGGSIQVMDNAPRGSVFTIDLPVKGQERPR